MSPIYIRINPRDNVAIVVSPEGVASGAELPHGLTARERIPQSHKVALRHLAPGDAILRYGEIIGHATRAIPAGSWVREDMLDIPFAPPLDSLPLATAVPPRFRRSKAALSMVTRNPDGSVGTKNILGITTTVQCVAPTVDYAVRRIRTELLPRFRNVDDAVALTHTYGCGVAIDAPGAAIPIRTLKHISLHANIGAHPLVVSLGCEKMQPARLFSSDLPVLAPNQRHPPAGPARLRRNHLRHHGGGRETSHGTRPPPPSTCPASGLVVGLQCGGSDAFSGVTCNPAVGYAADLLVRAGATVLFSEVTEVRDAIHLLTPRAANQDVARALIREMAWYDEYLAQRPRRS